MLKLLIHMFAHGHNLEVIGEVWIEKHKGAVGGALHFDGRPVMH